ncbi:protein-tyrosine-phosphatase [Aquamicrobium sp. LC103]|uniref:tyrosine phosphatase family protein n=1 Tax=Aquamicrobium sp. LC103 TaxID=1120658 RepID=UPI00063E918E|nr:protein-tyrosine-phosphatase [Aquamicrobium sp. LC103]TKT79071.1 protein tyrosine phosphatase [Aquamicrobium sp. LC103]
MIHVCPLSQVAATVESTNAGHLVTLLTEGTPFERPAAIEAGNHLSLAMHDIVNEQPEMVTPSLAHVEALVDFARAWDRRRPLIIHCFAGISRSTAAALIVAAALEPERDEAELARELRRLSPSATPNSLLVRLADGHLRREGRMISAVEAIGRGADAFEGTPFRLMLGQYRS